MPFKRAIGFEKKENQYEKKIKKLKKKFLDQIKDLVWKRDILVVVVEDIELWLTTKLEYLKAQDKKKLPFGFELISFDFDLKKKKEMKVI